MINLKTKGLPNSITVNGQSFLLNTDFSVWLDFPEKIKRLSKNDAEGYTKLFKSDVPMPIREVLKALQDFYHKKRDIPRMDRKESETVIDYDLDADYIYAGFMQAYGIDLKEVELHWHKFTALLAGLPEETFMVKIMQYRSYRGNSKDPMYRERMMLKQVWSLPMEITDEEREAMEEFEELFG